MLGAKLSERIINDQIHEARKFCRCKIENDGFHRSELSMFCHRSECKQHRERTEIIFRIINPALSYDQILLSLSLPLRQVFHVYAVTTDIYFSQQIKVIEKSCKFRFPHYGKYSRYILRLWLYMVLKLNMLFVHP